MASRFTELVVDCSDPVSLAKFWAEVLGYELKRDGSIDYIEGPDKSAPLIIFAPVPERKTVKNRLHIDVNPTDRDQGAEVERIVALGARRVDVGQGGDVSWVVLADPEGNEFCVLRSTKP
jgi:predicted enzyme related to lactoylglutathione lyase